MVKVCFWDREGDSRLVELDEGMSLMEGALNAGIDGIDADCGGLCSCATCHVFIDDDWLSNLPEPSSDEAAMLELARNPGPNSRLSCQIMVNSALEGLHVRVPESQR